MNVKYSTYPDSNGGYMDQILIYNDIDNDYLFVFDKKTLWNYKKRKVVEMLILRARPDFYPDNIDYIIQKHSGLAQLLIKHMNMLSPSWVEKKMGQRFVSMEYEYFVENIIPEMEYAPK